MRARTLQTERTWTRGWRRASGMSASFLSLAMGATLAARAADTFIKPAPEELAMTSLPGHPGAAAVVLFREETTTDDLHVVQHYMRIKILNEAGEKYANVRLNYVDQRDIGRNSYDANWDGKTVGDIAGRTIHSDGTVVAFTGKPYTKLLEQTEGARVEATVFTLPDVQVGSIIEYRYATRINDRFYEAPSWYIQSDLYLMSGHFVWYPTTKPLVQTRTGLPINSISWFSVLPPGVEVVPQSIPGKSSLNPTAQKYEVTVKDVPSLVKEEYMPPTSSYSYRVLFNFTPYHSKDDFWKSEGKDWSKRDDNFANPNPDLREATQTIIAGATTEDEKLRKIYAAVMALENTQYTRQHEEQEDKAEGEGKVKTAADVLSRKRGDSTQLTELFVGMARAAGLKAYLMLVPNRSEDVFTPDWLSFGQFHHLLAIVSVGGKEVFLDPGSRYCPYAHIAWEYTLVNGLRQTGGGTDFASTTGDSYSFNRTTRVANLTMDRQGEITGTINLSFSGAAALQWRHTALRGDNDYLRDRLQQSMQTMLPKSLEVKVSGMENLDAYEQPLLIAFKVTGNLGAPTGKLMVIPADLFEAGSTARFPHDKRENPVDFRYPHQVQDALRINLPEDFAVEATPVKANFTIPNRAVYDISVLPASTNVTTRRDFVQAGLLFQPSDYSTLRTFYSQFESKDHESVVLKLPVASTTAASSGTDK